MMALRLHLHLVHLHLCGLVRFLVGVRVLVFRVLFLKELAITLVNPEGC
jgi:hypothetical protein